MIGAGAVALQEIREVLLVFAAILLFSSFKVIVGEDEDDDEDDVERADGKGHSSSGPINPGPEQANVHKRRGTIAAMEASSRCLRVA